MLALVARVLRDPASLLDGELAELAPRLLAITLLGAAVFGGVAGSYRGGVQLVFAALKMPLLLLIPLVVGLPAVRGLFAGCGTEIRSDRLGMAGLVAAARTSILAAAASPLLWLLYSLGIDYHLAVLALAVALVAVGLPGWSTLRLVLPRSAQRRWLALTGSVAVLGLLAMQTGWVLRPFVARPTADVAFLRAVESDIFSGLSATGRSAVGDYSGWEAEEAGFVGKGMNP